MTQENTAHARFSPSNSKGWFACAGRLVLEAPIPNRSNKHSDDGTAKHEIARRCMVEDRQAAEFVGAWIPVHAAHEPLRQVKFTDDGADKVQSMVDVVAALAAHATVTLIEQRVDFSDVVQIPNQFGTADVVLLMPDGELVVADYKFGHTPVEVEENTQLLIYALGVYNELSLAADIKSIRLMILQPEASSPVTEWKCSVDYLLAFAETVRSKACSVLNAENDYGKVTPEVWERTYLNQNPNDKDCAYCRAMATCPSVARKVQETVGASFDAITEDGACASPSIYKDEALAAKMAAAGLIEDWITAVRAEVERRLLAGQEVPGFGLELGRKGNRKWADEAAVEKLIRETYRLKMEDAYDFSLKSPTAFERMSKPAKAEVDGKKVEVKPILGPRRWQDLQKHITRADPKPSVKPAAKIKEPYTPPKADDSAFSATSEAAQDDLAS